MSQSKRLSDVLSVCVILLIILNLVVLPFLPGLVLLGRGGQPLSALLFYSDESLLSPAYFFALAVVGVWSEPAQAVLTLFLLVCAVCSVIILWQGLMVLQTVRAGRPFQRSNARSMRRASRCCFVICAMAAVRCVWACLYYRTPAPLFTYNALFIPVFLMAGLLCLIIAALFGQAAALREENDLTI